MWGPTPVSIFIIWRSLIFQLHIHIYRCEASCDVFIIAESFIDNELIASTMEIFTRNWTEYQGIPVLTPRLVPSHVTRAALRRRGGPTWLHFGHTLCPHPATRTSIASVRLEQRHWQPLHVKGLYSGYRMYPLFPSCQIITIHDKDWIHRSMMTFRYQ